MHKVVRIRLGREFPLVMLLHEIFIPLLHSKMDRILFTPEVQMGPLHEIRRRLPSHQGVLPPVAFEHDVPIHAPVVAVPVAGLGCCFRGAVYSRDEGS